mmetsp:Transcript_20921/g.27503  ORF Transcript_20921/g.27503 Transcript_20921/m.27503 type:complete len:184 (-) Transcript_20921:132-683(-)
MGFLYDTCIAPCMLHRTLNEVRKEVNRLEEENDKLKVQNKRLEENTKKLKEVEGKLEEISILQGQNVDVLVEQVREFKSIQERVKENLEAKVMQNLISVVFSADSDGDFKIDPEEVEGLKLRLKTIEGVDFSEDNFEKALKSASKDGYDIQALLDVMKNLFDEEVADEDNIFTIKTETILEKK